jgi:hypothetical protein
MVRTVQLRSIYGKTRFPAPADFALTRHLIHWQVLALGAMVGANGGISQPSQRIRPTDLKPGRPPKSGGCGISGKAPWQIVV